MTTLSISPVNALISSQIQPTQRAMPICLRVAKYLSVAGAVAAVATIIYSIVASIFPLIALGAIFLATSFTSFYLIHQVADLKTIEEDSAIIKGLNESLAGKEAQIKQLTSQIGAVSDKFAAQNKEYARLSAADNAAQKTRNQELQRSVELLAKTEADAQKKIEQLRTSMTGQIQALQKQSEIDQKTIADLNLVVAKANDQNTALQTSLDDLKKQVGAYQQQIQTYSRLNTQLQQQLKTMSQAVQSPGVDISSINAHAATIEDAIAKQKAIAEKSAKTAAQINSMLDAINRRLPDPKPSQLTGK
jgi:chromosome segregation ATPase